jgi:nucleotide-binding universal stress UspA family protein
MIDPTRDPNPLHDFSGSIGLDARQNLKSELVKLEEARGRADQVKAHAILEAARNHLKEAGVSFSADAVHGHLAELIEEFEADTDLVVIGKRGESADFERMHIGASVERVIRSCHHPVLVASRAFRPIHRVLVAFDGGPSARKAIEFAIESPLLRETEIDLLTVGHPHPKVEDDMAAAKNQLEAAGYQVRQFHREGHPEDVFGKFIEEQEIDLLIMGAYGHSRIRQLIVGSTTTTMVRTCRVPILMFR